MIIIGLDPSLTGFGYAALEVEEQAAAKVLMAGVWETHPEKMGKKATDDNLERFAYLSMRLFEFGQATKPDRVFVEGTVLPFGKTAWNASLLGRCRGLVDMFGAAMGAGVAEFSPQELKKGMGVALKSVVGLSKREKQRASDDSKKEVREQVVRLYPEAAQLIPDGSIGNNASDAIAVAHVGNAHRVYRERLSSW